MQTQRPTDSAILKNTFGTRGSWKALSSMPCWQCSSSDSSSKPCITDVSPDRTTAAALCDEVSTPYEGNYRNQPPIAPRNTACTSHDVVLILNTHNALTV
eukprot:1161078-Pelagomonas_calceolata.AAC.3